MKRCWRRTVFNVGPMVLALAGWFTATGSQAQPAPEQLAQFRLGMSPAEARTVAPESVWAELNDDGDTVLSASGAALLAGRSYDVSIRSRSGAAYEVMLTRHDSSIQSLGECRTSVLETMAALASVHGPLVPMADPDPAKSPERIRAILPHRIADQTGAALLRLLETPIRQIERIDETRLDFVQNESWSGTGSWMGVRPADGRRPLLVASGAFGYGDQPPDCGFRVILSNDEALRPMARRQQAAFLRRVESLARTLPPLDERTLGSPDRLDPATVRPAWEASAAQRHWTLINRTPEERAMIPEVGATIQLECVVQRRQRSLYGRGTPWPCWTSDVETPAQLVAMASSIASHTQFRDADLGTQENVALLTRLDIHLSRDDLRASPPGGAHLLNMSDVVWSRILPAQYLNRFFNGDISEDMTLSAPCEIRDDGSLVCWPDDDGDRSSARLAASMRTVAMSYRAAPLLTDETPSAGRWVELVLNVKFAPQP